MEEIEIALEASKQIGTSLVIDFFNKIESENGED